MKPILHFILFSGVYLSAQALFAQNVGIGTSTPNASAKLEIVDANRGFLFPRVALTATNVAAPVTAPANWLVVFNTASAGTGATAVSPGLYYWDNTLLRWVRIQNETDAWRTLGNASTNPATNFIGTTDAQDFVTRTNNVERMRILASNGFIGVNNSTPGYHHSTRGQYYSYHLNNGGAYGLPAWAGNVVNGATNNPAFIAGVESDFVAMGMQYNGASDDATSVIGFGDNANNQLQIRHAQWNGTTGVETTIMTFSNTNAGVGTTNPDPTAMLDISAINKGLLIPRVSLSQTSSSSPILSAPTASLIVYNTATINDVTPGFYYWNGANWVRFQTSNTNNWTLLGNAGTNPAINFLGTTDGQPLVMRTSNAERIRVTGGGSVGIGTASPAQLLEVSGGHIRVSTSNPFIEWNGTYPPIPNLVTMGIRSAGELVTRTNTNNTTISDWETKAGTGTNAFPNDCYYVGRRANPTVTNPSYFFHIDASGNVGVNTTSQNALLHVNHSTQNSYSALTDPHIVQIGSSGTLSHLVFALNGAASNSSVIQSKASASTAWGLSLNPHGGNVGVGVINPQTKFHTVGASRFEQNAATIQLVGAAAGHSYIEYYPYGIASGRQGYIGYPTNGSTSFNFYNENATGDVNFGVGGTAASVDMTVKNNGFVGIATTSPNQKLTVEAGNIEIGNNNDNVLVSRNNAQNLHHQMIGTYMGWDTRGVYLAGYNQNNIGAAPYNATNRIYAGGSFGSLPISATAFTVVSAKRYKQNILPVAYGLSSILNLNPVQYQYNFEQEKPTHVGFIAEEVEKVIPEIVVKQTNPETANYGQAMGVNYTELVPVLVKGMQEQQTEIETLKKQNARLEAELQEIKKMLLEKK